MTFLLLVIIASTGIIISFKLFPRYKVDRDQAITINYLTASIFGILTNTAHTTLPEIGRADWFYFALLVGPVLIIGFHLFALSAQMAGVAVTAIGSRMSVVIPVLSGFLLFGDTAGPTKIAGIMLALVALYLTSKKETTKIIEKKTFFLPLMLFFAAGFNDTLIKMAQEWYITNDYLEFLSTAFFFAFLIGVILLIFKKKLRSISFSTVAGGIIVGIINFGSILFLLRGLALIEVSTFMPLYNVSVVALSALIGYVFFKERLSALNWAGIALAILSILLIAMN
ncbi:MAG: DMT family transporter [Bacteroidales bacterium]|nr:DMT family transporter [Bacteroidales bacterium]MDY0284867.1 DMT family transporter [Bacteroidales bacterium]